MSTCSEASTSPASMYCPPVVWWQWTAIRFSPFFSAFSASVLSGRRWYWTRQPPAVAQLGVLAQQPAGHARSRPLHAQARFGVAVEILQPDRHQTAGQRDLAAVAPRAAPRPVHDRLTVHDQPGPLGRFDRER